MCDKPLMNKRIIRDARWVSVSLLEEEETEDALSLSVY